MEYNDSIELQRRIASEGLTNTPGSDLPNKRTASR